MGQTDLDRKQSYRYDSKDKGTSFRVVFICFAFLGGIIAFWAPDLQPKKKVHTELES